MNGMRSSNDWGHQPPKWERMDKELAAHYVSERLPVVQSDWTIGQVHDYMSENGKSFEILDYIYVVDARRHLVGVLSMRDLFIHGKKTPVRSVMSRNIISASPEMHKEKVARLAMHNNLRAIPLVKNKQFEGVIQTTTLLHLINRTLRENILRFSGIHEDHMNFENTLEVPLSASIRHRAPWLFIGLIGVMITAGIVNQFESLLDKHIILAFFIPAIVYMSDALGTQNQTLLIRDIAIMGKELKVVPYVVKTMLIAAIISLFLGGVVFGLTTLIWNDAHIAGVIALAMVCTLLVSGFTSIITTLVFQRLGQDPALGSGPFATIISDMTSIIIYFVIVSLLL